MRTLIAALGVLTTACATEQTPPPAPVAATLEAQATSADSAAIRKAAESSGGHIMFFEIVGDTAIVVGSTERRLGPDTTRRGDGSVTISEGMAFDDWEARVERRRGKWVLVRREMK